MIHSTSHPYQMPDRGPIGTGALNKMPYRDLIQHWHDGVLAADKKDYDLALEKFRSIEDPPAKMCFNIGCLHLLKGGLQQSLEAFDRSVSKDHCLAVGFSQRSYVYFRLQRYEKALSDCHLALAHLRNNTFIDYKQLGLKYVLHTWEVLYNTAAVLCHLGRWQSAEEKLMEAVKWVPGEAKNSKLEAALDSVQRRFLLIPTHVPEGELFRPKKQEVEQLNSKDFLGKPKVIVSVVPNDQYSGFEPLRPQNRGFYEPHRDAVLGHQAGYHRVLIHYYPEESSDVAVKANNVVFVLNKEGEWAAAIHNGQKILIPASILEPVNAPKSNLKQDDNGIPMPPMKTPPSRPRVKPSPEQILWLKKENQVPSLVGLPPRPEGTPPAPSKLKKESIDETRALIATETPALENDVSLTTNPVLATAVPLTRVPVLDIAVPLGRAPLIERSLLTANQETERPPPTTDQATERSRPPTTDQAAERSRPPTTDQVAERSPPSSTDQVAERSRPPTTDQAAERSPPPTTDQVAERFPPPIIDLVGERSPPTTDQVAERSPPPITDLNNESRKVEPDPRRDDDNEIALQVHTEFTVSMKVQKDITYPELQDLLRQKLRQHGEQMNIELSYRESEGKSLTPVKGDEDLQGMLKQMTSKHLMFCCRDAFHCVGRPVLYRMRALYEYPAEGPEDLTFNPEDTIDILSEVNEEWLEGHCNGNIGIFPKCFASRLEDS